MQFEISDVGLRKICVRLNVPTPPNGYRAKTTQGMSRPAPILSFNGSSPKINGL